MIKKLNKRTIFQLLVIIIGICFIPIYYYSINIYSIFAGNFESKALNVYDSDLCGIVVDENGLLRTTTNDSYLYFSDVNLNVENISLNLTSANTDPLNIQIYYDNGQGFSESNSKFFRIKKGHNILKLDGKVIKELRLDVGTEVDVLFELENIIVNNRSFSFFSAILLFEFSLLGFVCYLTIKDSRWWLFKCILNLFLMYNYFKFYCLYSHVGFIHFTVFILMIMMIFTINLFWERNSNDEAIS